MAAQIQGMLLAMQDYNLDLVPLMRRSCLFFFPFFLFFFAVVVGCASHMGNGGR